MILQGLGAKTDGRYTASRKVILTLTDSDSELQKSQLDFQASPRGGGGFEYLHRSPASRRKRRQGDTVPGGITGPPCPWGI
jgi:hypothetical protein